MLAAADNKATHFNSDGDDKKGKNNITMTITIKKMMMPICPFSESHKPALLDKMHPFCRTTLHHTVPPRLRKHVGEGVEAERGERGERGERREG